MAALFCIVSGLAFLGASASVRFVRRVSLDQMRAKRKYFARHDVDAEEVEDTNRMILLVSGIGFVSLGIILSVASIL